MPRKNKTIDRLQAIWNMIGGDDVVDALIKGRAILEVKWIIVRWIGKIRISATTEPFEVKKSFKTDSKEINLKDNGLRENFQVWFLTGSGKIEEPCGQEVICYGDLLVEADNSTLFAELGVGDRAEVLLHQIYDLLKKQSKGEVGPLLTNGYSNIFYVRDQDGVLRVIDLVWCGGVWNISAGFFKNPCGGVCSDGFRVFSRDA